MGIIKLKDLHNVLTLAKDALDYDDTKKYIEQAMNIVAIEYNKLREKSVKRALYGGGK